MKYLEYNEKKQHGSPAFPIQYYYLDSAHPHYEMVLHWHSAFEMIYIISGHFKLFLNNIEYSLASGDVMLIDCGTLHRGEPEDCVYECLVFDLGMLRKSREDAVAAFVQPLINGNMSARCLLTKSNDMIYSCACGLFAAMRDEKPFYELAVYGALYRFFGLLYEQGLVSKVTKQKRVVHRTNTVTDLIDWIEAHYTEPITLSRLSRVSGLNEKYLCRLFKEYTHSTPISYINRLRIENACREISENHRNITEAALESGFNDLSYFSRIFKKIKGITPREYKSESRG